MLTGEELFGGNEGIVSPETLHTSGNIKHVYEEVEESELVDNINNRYNVSNVELFQRDNKYTGTLKVTFKERNAKHVVADNIQGLDVLRQQHSVRLV